VYINEIAHNADGSFLNEAIEVAILTGRGITASQVSVELIDGTTGLVYRTMSVSVDFTIGQTYCIGTPNQVTLFFITFSLVSDAIQDGPADGIAIGIDGVLEEHLVYNKTQGDTYAPVTQGMANGTTPEDTGIFGPHPINFGFSRVGTARPRDPRDFTWGLRIATLGSVNNGQMFVCT